LNLEVRRGEDYSEKCYTDSFRLLALALHVVPLSTPVGRTTKTASVAKMVTMVSPKQWYKIAHLPQLVDRSAKQPSVILKTTPSCKHIHRQLWRFLQSGTRQALHIKSRPCHLTDVPSVPGICLCLCRFHPLWLRSRCHRGCHHCPIFCFPLQPYRRRNVSDLRSGMRSPVNSLQRSSCLCLYRRRLLRCFLRRTMR